MRRRTLVLGAGAVVATAAGLGASLLMPRRRPPAEQAAPDAASTDPWSMSFAGLDGAPVALASLRGRPLLLNFWATWCGPCATEMPLLDRFAASPAAARWNVLALAVDDAPHVQQFVAERGLRLPIALAGVDGIDLSRALGNTVGALPFTVVFATDGMAKATRLGSLDQAMLDGWAASLTA